MLITSCPGIAKGPPPINAAASVLSVISTGVVAGMVIVRVTNILIPAEENISVGNINLFATVPLTFSIVLPETSGNA